MLQQTCSDNPDSGGSNRGWGYESWSLWEKPCSSHGNQSFGMFCLRPWPVWSLHRDWDEAPKYQTYIAQGINRHLTCRRNLTLPWRGLCIHSSRTGYNQGKRAENEERNDPFASLSPHCKCKGRQKEDWKKGSSKDWNAPKKEKWKSQAPPSWKTIKKVQIRNMLRELRKGSLKSHQTQFPEINQPRDPAILYYFFIVMHSLWQTSSDIKKMQL